MDTIPDPPHVASMNRKRCVTRDITRHGTHGRGSRKSRRRTIRERNAIKFRSTQPRNCPNFTPERLSVTYAKGQAQIASGTVSQSRIPRNSRRSNPPITELLRMLLPALMAANLDLEPDHRTELHLALRPQSTVQEWS